MESITEALEQYRIDESIYQYLDSMSQPDHEYYDDYYPDLGNLTIDDILTQDDPPKELYLRCDLLDFTEEEYILDMLFEDECTIDIYNEFNIYHHFGIYDDNSDEDKDARLEAAVSGYEK